jgi:hypothetical protein
MHCLANKGVSLLRAANVTFRTLTLDEPRIKIGREVREDSAMDLLFGDSGEPMPRAWANVVLTFVAVVCGAIVGMGKRGDYVSHSFSSQKRRIAATPVDDGIWLAGTITT